MSRPCPLRCGSRALPLKAMRYALPEGSPLPAETVVSQCQACGFLYADSAASAEDYRAHYQSGSIYAASDLRPGDGSSENDERRLRHAASRLLNAMEPGSLLIDIGAATGGLLEAAARLGHSRSLGLDPDPACVRAMLSRGMGAREATLGSMPSDLQGQAGGAALSHVLEHLWEPVEGLRQALSLLREGGALYIETPDAGRYHLFPNALNYYFDPEHINHFTLEDFETLARRAGARLIDCGQAELTLEDGSGYPAAWAILRKEPPSKRPEPPAPAARSPHPALAYIQQQNERERQARLAFESALRDIPSALIWGTGSHAQRSLASGAIPSGRVAAFIDSDPSKQGKSLLGRPILSPAQAFERHAGLPVMILAARAAERSIRAALGASWPHQAIIEPPRS